MRPLDHHGQGDRVVVQQSPGQRHAGAVDNQHAERTHTATWEHRQEIYWLNTMFSGDSSCCGSSYYAQNNHKGLHISASLLFIISPWLLEGRNTILQEVMFLSLVFWWWWLMESNSNISGWTLLLTSLKTHFLRILMETRLTNMFCEIVFPESWVLAESKTSVKNCSCCAVLDCCK